MNIFTGIGNITKDIAITQTTTTVARFSVALNRKYKKDGEPTADFINCVAFGKTAEFIGKYFSKGKKIAFTAHVQTGFYMNKDGAKVYTTDFVINDCEFVESKSQQSGPTQQPASNGFMNIPDEISEELPFC